MSLVLNMPTFVRGEEGKILKNRGKTRVRAEEQSK